MKKIILLLFLLTFVSLKSQTVTSSPSLMDGYTNKQSYRAGENVVFFTKANISFGNVTGNLLRKGDNAVAATIPGINANQQGTQNNFTGYIDGYNYAATANWIVKPLAVLPSFVYLLDMPNPIPIVIKGDKNDIDVVIVYPTNTENAYCNSGGKSLYPFNSSSSIISTTLSFNRPLGINPDAGSKFTDGFLNWIISSNRFGTSKVGFICDADMDDYSEIQNAKLLIIIGHSEYWTRKARENFDRFVDSGKNALILSGNTMWWQVRLQPDPFNPNNPQMVCNKAITSGIVDGICDTLLYTNNWNDTMIKYSTLSSIGSDWGIGGFANDQGNSSFPGKQGYGTHKVILPNSPIFNGVSFTFDPLLNSKVLNPYFDNDTEVDGTLVSGLDVSGNPILDKEALGLYKTDLISYDIANPETNPQPVQHPINPPYYTGIMALQKTCNSGRIINVNSNEWCKPQVMSQTDIQAITQNMINLMLTGANIFTNALPSNIFIIKPQINNVSYEGCKNGTIRITPCGVNINDGYNISKVNQSFSAKIIDCSSCSRGSRFGNTSQTSSEEINGISSNAENESGIILYPNPNSGIFKIEVKLPEQHAVVLNIESISGQLIYKSHEDIFNGSAEFTINLNGKPEGMYLLKLFDSNAKQLLKAQKILINR